MVHKLKRKKGLAEGINNSKMDKFMKKYEKALGMK